MYFQTLNNLKIYEIVVIACITESAKNMLPVLKIVNNVKSKIMSLKCLAHFPNLMFNDVSCKIKTLKNQISILQHYIITEKINSC